MAWPRVLALCLMPIFSTFWPSAYDDAYWAYAYDDFVDTVFFDVGSPYSAYASTAPGGYLEPGGAFRRPVATRGRVTLKASQR